MQSPVNPTYPGSSQYPPSPVPGYQSGGYPMNNAPSPGYPAYQPGQGQLPQHGQPSGYQVSQPGQAPGYQMSQPGQVPGYPMPQSGQAPGYPMSQTQAPGYLGNQQGQQNPMPDYQGGGGPAPNALNINQMQPLPGYEGISFDPTPSAPPPPNFQSDHLPGEAQQFNDSMPTLTIEDAREALIKFASSNCCFGNNPARNMTLADINYKSTFHYTLESYTEKRETFWEFEPYNKGSPISCGVPPGPWEISVPVQTEYIKGHTAIEVPNTACVRPCHGCMALGRRPCKTCVGCGHANCTWCQGKGTRFVDEKCKECNGTGRSKCHHCHGNGHTSCDICKEKQQLRFFVRLKVTWSVHKDDFISDSTSIPEKKIRKVTGQTAFKDEGLRVYPASSFPDPSVASASSKLVTKHQTEYAQERILKQRHEVRIIPIAEVKGKWNEEPKSFCIYGFENTVYFPDYPQKCCCGCSVL